MNGITYQLFHERDKRLQVLLKREMKLVAVPEIDRN